MTDIVERLRKDAASWGGATHTATGPRTAQLELEAADEIERLRKALEEIASLYSGGCAYRATQIARDALSSTECGGTDA